MNAWRQRFTDNDAPLISFIGPGVPSYKAQDVSRQFNCGANSTSNNAADGTGVAIAFTVAFCRGRLGQCYYRPQRDCGHDTSEHLLAHVHLL
jgi:hypothetical protein